MLLSNNDALARSNVLFVDLFLLSSGHCDIIVTILVRSSKFLDETNFRAILRSIVKVHLWVVL